MAQIQGLHHIGIAPKDIEASISFFRDILELPYDGSEELAQRGIKTHFFRTTENKNDAQIEIIESLSEPSEISKFVHTRGGGIHHLCLRVLDLDALHAKLRKACVEIIGHGPQEGAHGTRVMFIHPRSTGGILLELVESNI